MHTRAPTQLIAITAVLAALACSASDSTSESTPEPAAGSTAAASPANTDTAPWYSSARTLDLTGDGVADTVRLVATGDRPDSLRITLSFLVAGKEKHREDWGSSYELTAVDSVDRRSPRVDTVLRARLDSALASVRVQAFNAPGVELMAEDSAVFAGLDPRPTHRVSFSYGFESTTRLVWDAPRARFVRLWSCC